MNKLNTIRIIHLAFCAGPSLFLAMALLLNQGGVNFSFDNIGTEPGLIIAPIMTITLIPVSAFIFKTLLKKALENSGIAVSDKLMQYQTAFIIRCALIESAALFNGVMLLITGNVILLIFGVIAIAVLWLARPTKEKVQEDLNLQYPETIDSL